MLTPSAIRCPVSNTRAVPKFHLLAHALYKKRNVNRQAPTEMYKPDPPNGGASTMTETPLERTARPRFTYVCSFYIMSSSLSSESCSSKYVFLLMVTLVFFSICELT